MSTILNHRGNAVTSKEPVVPTFERIGDALFACDTETLDALMAADYRGYNLRAELEDRNVVLEVYRPDGPGPVRSLPCL